MKEVRIVLIACKVKDLMPQLRRLAKTEKGSSAATE